MKRKRTILDPDKQSYNIYSIFLNKDFMIYLNFIRMKRVSLINKIFQYSLFKKNIFVGERYSSILSSNGMAYFFNNSMNDDMREIKVFKNVLDVSCGLYHSAMLT